MHNFVEGTPSLYLLDVILVCILVLIYWPVLIKKRQVSNRFITLSKIIVVLFCVFAFWGNDWFHYEEDFKMGFEDTTAEPLYGDIVKYFSDYLVFRLALWGCAFLLVLKGFKLLNIDNNVILGLFCLSPLLWFSYARASFSMVLIFFGMVIALYDSNSWYKFLFGICIIMSAFFFHKSSLFGIIIAVLAILATKIKPKATVTITILLVPLFIYTLKNNMITFVDSASGQLTTIGSYAKGGQFYLQLGDSPIHVGIAEFLLRLLEHTIIYVGSFLSLRLIFSEIEIPNVVKSISIYAILVAFFSSLFILDYGVNTTIIYSRFMRFASLPIVVPVSYCFVNSIFPKLTNAYLYLSLASLLSMTFYAYYNVLT